MPSKGEIKHINHHFRVSLKGFLIAMSSAWGLFQIIIFLGYGVVSVPKHCLKMASI